MSKLNSLMLAFTRPGCEKGIEKLREIEGDINYLNKKVIPAMRKAGITHTTLGEILNFSRMCNNVECGLSSREIMNRDFISYSGKRVFFTDKAFLTWYIQTPEGKENKSFCEIFSPKALLS